MRDSSFTYTELFAKYTLNVIVLREQFKRRHIKSKFVHGGMYGPPSDRLFARIYYPNPTVVSRRILAENNSLDTKLTCRVLLNELFIYFNCWILMFAVFF